jgi:DinB superfamily
MNRYGCLTLGAIFGCACALPAQTPNPLSAEVKWSYGSIKNNLLKMAEKMPAERYDFRPTPEVETFGRRVAHIADANMNVCTGLNPLPNNERKPLGAASKTSKAELVAALKESFAYCDRVFDSLTDASAKEMVSSRLGGPFPPEPTRSRLATLYNLVRHSNEMYGYMAVYLRLSGVVPPTSAPE